MIRNKKELIEFGKMNKIKTFADFKADKIYIGKDNFRLALALRGRSCSEIETNKLTNQGDIPHLEKQRPAWVFTGQALIDYFDKD